MYPRFSLLLFSVVASCQSASGPSVNTLADFGNSLETLRATARIPAISAAIVKDQNIVWTKGYGIANIEANTPATDSTTYHFASLTKPFAAAIIMQLVGEGKVSLDDPVSKYGIVIPGATATILVRHLMSHTSSGTPGTRFAYDGNRFGELDSVIARATGNPFAVELQRRIVQPLGLRHLAPNPLSAAFQVSGQNHAAYMNTFARGYTFTDGRQNLTPFPGYFGTAAGLVGSVSDLAQFSMALDRGDVLSPALRDLAFTPARTPGGEDLPYGLGWFSTQYKGVHVVWHYGLWTAISSLIIKVPERGLTFVLLGNSDQLSAPYQLGAGKLETSPWARLFLDTFVLRRVPLTD